MGNNQYIVEFDGVISTKWFEKIRRAGGTIYNPYGPTIFRCVCDIHSAEQIAALDFVKRIIPFPLSWKLPIEYRSKPIPQCDNTHWWVQLFDQPASLDAVRAKLSSFGTILSQRLTPSRVPDFLLESSSANLPALAALDFVFRLSPFVETQDEDEVACQIVAGNLDKQGRPFGPKNTPRAPLKFQTTYLAWLAKIGVRGDGVMISILEHSGYVNGKHGSFGKRVTYFGCDKGKEPPENKLGAHATMVAGQAAGGPIQGGNDQDEKDANGYYYGLGIAPGSSILSHTTSGSNPYDYCTVAVQGGATIQNASWGGKSANLSGVYEEKDHYMDWATRNSDNSTNTGKLTPLCICTSAGNNGASSKKNRGLSYPARAKNVITVGNFSNYRPKLDIRPEDVNLLDSVNKRYPSSSIGDCGDGRIKPDVVAPGTWTAAARFSQKDKKENKAQIINDHYIYGNGTSAAAPKVAGACALLTEWWKKKFNNLSTTTTTTTSKKKKKAAGQDPSPAMLKAILINTAVDTKWETDDDLEDRMENWKAPTWKGHIPNMEQGWGRVCLNNFFLPPKNVEMFFSDQEYVLETENDQPKQLKFTFQVANKDHPLKATLVWTDYAGTPGTGVKSNTAVDQSNDDDNDDSTVVDVNPCLVNVLGFRMTAPDKQVYFGNCFENGFSKGTKDLTDSKRGYQDKYLQNISGRPVNNVQNIYIEKPMKGQNYELIIAGILLANDALNPNQSGHSRHNGRFRQDFALFIWNGSNVTGPESQDLDFKYDNYCKPKSQVTA